MQIQINPNKTITINEKIDSKELYKFFIGLWMKNPEFVGLGFPLKDSKNGMTLSEGWSFDSAESFRNVTPKIKMNEPIPPMVPSQTRKYERIYVSQPLTVEKLLSACPPEIHNKNVHIKSDDNGIYLEILGHWPNPDWELDQKKFQEHCKEWEKEYLLYEAIVKAS